LAWRVLGEKEDEKVAMPISTGVKKVPPSGDGQECPICLISLDETSHETLKCHHVFHSECIGKWKQEHPSCPMCRTSL